MDKKLNLYTIKRIIIHYSFYTKFLFSLRRHRERKKKLYVGPTLPVAPRGLSLYIRMYALVICEEMNEVSKKTSENDRSHEIDVAMREAISAERK